MEQEISNIGASSSLSASSPSFTTYSSENIADIAARVVHELNLSHDHPYDDDFYSSIHHDVTITNNDVDDDVESEFEFAVLSGGDTSSPISADDIFYNGVIKPVYPLFNTSLIYNDDAVSVPETETAPRAKVRLPLRKLMREEENDSMASLSSSSSSSSYSGAELEGVPPETYCVWAPGKKGEIDNDTVGTMKKKSNSTGGIVTGVGSSKRWRGLKDLMHRSHSHGKGSFVFLSDNENEKNEKKVTAVNKNYGKKQGEVKKKYIAYREDFIGFLGNVNGISRTIRPF